MLPEIRRIFRSIYVCLAWRLVFLLVVTLVGLLGLSGWLALRVQHDQMVELLEEQAISLGEIILSSTHSSMLDNDQRQLGEIIANVGSRERVHALRLVDAHGEVRHSSHPEEIGQVSDLDAPLCQGCHSEEPPVIPHQVRDGLFTYSLDSGEVTIGLAVPVLNGASCSSAQCHVHPPDQEVLGILDLEVSAADLAGSIARARRQMILFGVVTVISVSVVVGILSWRVVHRPIHDLLDGTRRLGKGDLAHRIRSGRTRDFGELGELAHSLNDMAARLAAARSELQAWNQRLEDRVDEKTRELELARDHMVFAEKMVSLGKLAAIVAHEVNNPLAGVLVSTKLVRRQLKRREEGNEEIDRTLAMVERETARCGDIVRNLLLFSRHREASFAPENANQILERAMRLVQHQADLQEVHAVTELEDGLPEVVCDAGQIEQACLALIMNSIEAMPDGGTLTLRTRSLHEPVRIRIEIVDTGIGIPAGVRSQIFEPFFTTKNHGRGTGLGLSVMYGIVQRHQGTVDFASERGLGTTFWIELPLEQDLAWAAELSGANTRGEISNV